MSGVVDLAAHARVQLARQPAATPEAQQAVAAWWCGTRRPSLSFTASEFDSLG